MTMEVDIELSFPLKKLQKNSYRENEINNYYDTFNIDTENNLFTVSKEYELKTITLSEAIIEFLMKFEGVYSEKLDIEKVLKLGIYYELKDTVVFPIILTRACITALYRFNVKLEASGYPCSD